MTALQTDLLAELIRRKLECLVQLRETGKKQLELIRADRVTDLLDVLSAKQRQLIELQRIEQALAPFRGQDPNQRRWPTPDARRKCAEQLAECQSLLGEIVTLEEQSERELTRRRDDLAARLRGIDLASQARGAYLAQSHPEVSRIDLASER